IYRIIRQIHKGLTALDIHLRYQVNKTKCGRKKIELTPPETDYINEKVLEGWTPDVIVGRGEKPIPCSMRALYRKFESGEFDQEILPMKGKRKPDGHQEKRGRQSFKRSIQDREREHSDYQEEFGH